MTDHPILAARSALIDALGAAWLDTDTEGAQACEAALDAISRHPVLVAARSRAMAAMLDAAGDVE